MILAIPLIALLAPFCISNSLQVLSPGKLSNEFPYGMNCSYNRYQVRGG